MALLPPSTNADYRGSRFSTWFLCLSAALTIVPGMIHYFLPDGGAGVIAHMDLTTRADVIISLFAWNGAIQIPYGILILIIALRYQSLVPLVLLALILMQSLATFSAWFWKGSHGDHHPPGHYGHAVFLVLSVVFLILSLRPQRAQSELIA